MKSPSSSGSLARGLAEPVFRSELTPTEERSFPRVHNGTAGPPAFHTWASHKCLKPAASCADKIILQVRCVDASSGRPNFKRNVLVSILVSLHRSAFFAAPGLPRCATG